MSYTKDPSAPYGEIYLITCLVNGKCYVGQTTQHTMARWASHKAMVGKDKWPIHCAMKVHGIENFSLAVLDRADNQSDLDAKEAYWIRVLGTIAPNGYNLKDGGMGGKHTQETKDKLSKMATGRTHTQETKDKISLTSKGRKQPRDAVERTRQSNLGSTRTEDTKAKMRASWHRTPEGAERIRQARLGAKHTPEAKARMAAATRARWDKLKGRTPSNGPS